MTEARTYRFADANRPGLLLGLSVRQAGPLIGGIVFLAAVLQSPLPPVVGVAGPAVGAVAAFGRWRGTPLVEIVVPTVRLQTLRVVGRRRWVRPPLLADNTTAPLPRVLHGLELVEAVETGIGIVRDRNAGTVTGVLRVRGEGFPLASPIEQDAIVAGWGAAMSPFAREGSPVSQVVWQEWAHPVGAAEHHAFLSAVGLDQRRDDPAVADYVGLIDEQAPVTIAHDTLIAVTIDQRRVRARRRTRSRWTAAADTLRDELRLFAGRLDAAGLTVDPPLSGLQVSAAIRLRSDPTRAMQVAALQRSLAAAARRGALEWGPMVVEADWSHVHVDGVFHRSYRISTWPQLPVGSDWLAGLLVDTNCVRTITVVWEPVPMRRAARAADREVMAREADADLKQQKGFRINARERKRLADVEAREGELAQGHAEFGIVGLVTVTAATLDQLDDDCADVEQAAAQSLLDLRPLEARHEHGWVTALPVGRAVARPAAQL